MVPSLYSKFGPTEAFLTSVMTVPLLSVTAKSLPLSVLGRGGHENWTWTTSMFGNAYFSPQALRYWAKPIVVVNAHGFVRHFL